MKGVKGFVKGYTPWNKGIPTCNETKEKIRKNIATNPNFGMRGKKRTKEANRKAVETRMKNGSYKWTEEQKEKARERIVSKEVKQKISKKLKGIKRGPMKEKTKEIFRINMAKRIIKRGHQMYGKNETKILDKLEELYGYKILRQYQIIGYILDGYIKELNLAIEVDEPAHFSILQQKKDKQRQKRIEKELNCKFLRIKDK